MFPLNDLYNYYKHCTFFLEKHIAEQNFKLSIAISKIGYHAS